MTKALLAEGATVAVAARATPRLEQTVVRLRARRGWRPSHCRSMCATPPRSAVRDGDRTRWPRLHLVVNNAGIGMRTVNPRFLEQPQPFWQVSPQGWSDLLATDLSGYFLSPAPSRLLPRAAPRPLRQRHHQPGDDVPPRLRPLRPSRARTESLSLIMAEDLRPHGIAVNLLLPAGATLTG